MHQDLQMDARNKSHSYCGTAILGFSVLLYLAGYVHCQTGCPCDVDLAKQAANCANKNLKEVPACVPNCVRTLILEDNNFTNIKTIGLKRFSNLTLLDLR